MLWMPSELNLCDCFINKLSKYDGVTLEAHIKSLPTNRETQGTPNPLPFGDPDPVAKLCPGCVKWHNLRAALSLIGPEAAAMR